MSLAVIEEIRRRSIYLSEVKGIILTVLRSFQADAAASGINIEIEATTSRVMGPTVEISERTGDSKSSVYVEIYTAGHVDILKDINVNGSPGTSVEDRRSIDFSKPSEASATDIILMLAEDHFGFVGSKLEAYLDREIFGNPAAKADPGLDL